MFTTIFSAIGETYLSDDDVLWWAKDGKLKGKSPERIAFLRELMESLPSAIEPWYEPESVTFGDEFLGYKADPDHPIISLVTSLTEPENDAGALKDKIFSGRCGNQVYIKYLGNTAQENLSSFFQKTKNTKSMSSIPGT